MRKKKFSTKQHVDTHHQAVMDAFSDSGGCIPLGTSFILISTIRSRRTRLMSFHRKSIEGVGVSNQIDNCVGTGRLKMIEDGKTRFLRTSHCFSC